MRVAAVVAGNACHGKSVADALRFAVTVVEPQATMAAGKTRGIAAHGNTSVAFSTSAARSAPNAAKRERGVMQSSQMAILPNGQWRPVMLFVVRALLALYRADYQIRIEWLNS